MSTKPAVPSHRWVSPKGHQTTGRWLFHEIIVPGAAVPICILLFILTGSGALVLTVLGVSIALGLVLKFARLAWVSREVRAAGYRSLKAYRNNEEPATS